MTPSSLPLSLGSAKLFYNVEPALFPRVPEKRIEISVYRQGEGLRRDPLGGILRAQARASRTTGAVSAAILRTYCWDIPLAALPLWKERLRSTLNGTESEFVGRVRITPTTKTRRSIQQGRNWCAPEPDAYIVHVESYISVTHLYRNRGSESSPVEGLNVLAPDNFGNWLRSPQGWLFYLTILVMMSLVPTLIILRRQRKPQDLQGFPAIQLWVLQGLIPLVLILVFNAASLEDIKILFNGLDVGYGAAGLLSGAVFFLASAAPLLVGVFLTRQRNDLQRLPSVLIWFGLASPCVILTTLFVPWGSFPSVGAVLIAVSVMLLVLGIVVLTIGRRRTRRYWTSR